jgi:hypothetical protein
MLENKRVSEDGMRTKVWLAILMVAGLLAVALGTTTAFAQNPPAIPPYTDNATWAAMRQACVNGDYQTMTDLANRLGCGLNGAGGNLSDNSTGPYGPAGGMGGWGCGGYAPQSDPQNTTQYAPRRGGMMGGGWRGMMGTW